MMLNKMADKAEREVDFLFDPSIFGNFFASKASLSNFSLKNSKAAKTSVTHKKPFARAEMAVNIKLGIIVLSSIEPELTPKDSMISTPTYAATRMMHAGFNVRI